MSIAAYAAISFHTLQPANHLHMFRLAKNANFSLSLTARSNRKISEVVESDSFKNCELQSSEQILIGWHKRCSKIFVSFANYK